MNGEKDGEREGGNERRNGEMDVWMHDGMENGWRDGGLVIPYFVLRKVSRGYRLSKEGTTRLGVPAGKSLLDWMILG